MENGNKKLSRLFGEISEVYKTMNSGKTEKENSITDDNLTPDKVDSLSIPVVKQSLIELGMKESLVAKLSVSKLRKKLKEVLTEVSEKEDMKPKDFIGKRVSVTFNAGEVKWLKKGGDALGTIEEAEINDDDDIQLGIKFDDDPDDDGIDQVIYEKDYVTVLEDEEEEEEEEDLLDEEDLEGGEEEEEDEEGEEEDDNEEEESDVDDDEEEGDEDDDENNEEEEDDEMIDEDDDVTEEEEEEEKPKRKKRGVKSVKKEKVKEPVKRKKVAEKVSKKKTTKKSNGKAKRGRPRR